MNILNVTTTKNAVSTTENAVYELEYSISNNKLIRVMISIYAIKVNQEEETYIGQILLENDMLSISFISNVIASKLLADYESILQQINKDINSK